MLQVHNALFLATVNRVLEFVFFLELKHDSNLLLSIILAYLCEKASLVLLIKMSEILVI